VRKDKLHTTLEWLRRSTLHVLFAAFLMVAGYLFATPNPKLCATTPQIRQLDFWLGNWSISNPGTSGTGKSKVYLLLNQCLFVESWDNGKGHAGQNLFAYSADDRTWYGMFADNEGRTHIFNKGKVDSGSAEFDGKSRGPEGVEVLNRVKVLRNGPDKVEQTWEKSTDQGANWKMVFRGEYVRKNQ
jgi:hypothetical protein